jgi:hypothetical protein
MVCFGKFVLISSVTFVISFSLFDVRDKCLRIVRNVFDNVGLLVVLSSWKPPIDIVDSTDGIDWNDLVWYVWIYWLNGCK